MQENTLLHLLVHGDSKEGKAAFLAHLAAAEADTPILHLPGKYPGDGLMLYAQSHGIAAPGWFWLKSGCITAKGPIEVDTQALLRFKEVYLGGTHADYGDAFSDLRFSVQYATGAPVLCGSFWQTAEGLHSGISFEIPLQDLPGQSEDFCTAHRQSTPIEQAAQSLRMQENELPF